MELIQFGCSRSAELAFSLPALPLAELQPPPPITEVSTSITVSAPHQPEGLWCIPSCLAGMFVERIKAFKELDVFSDFYLCGFVDLCKDLVVLYLSWRELVNNPCLRFQPFKFDSLA